MDSDSEKEHLSNEIAADTLQKDVTKSHVLGVSNVEERQSEDQQNQSIDDSPKNDVATSSLPEESIQGEQNVDEQNQSHDNLRKKDVAAGTVPETIMAGISNFEEQEKDELKQINLNMTSFHSIIFHPLNPLSDHLVPYNHPVDQAQCQFMKLPSV